MLDSKLNWNLNTISRTTKVSTALYCCKKAIGLNWGLNPKNAYWLCECIVKPILFYGSTVWWLALEKKNHQNKFERIMRTMAIMITGALRTTPTKALLTILNWLPPDILAKQIAAQTAVRLKANKAWNKYHYGHAKILGIVNWNKEVDYVTPGPTFDPSFQVEIPDETYYDNGLLIPDDTIAIFTDGSKTRESAGCGIYSEQLNLRLSFKLPCYSSVLQAEIMAIKLAAEWIQYHEILHRNIHILTDSKAAINSLVNVYTTSKIVQECRASLEEIARHSSVTLIWVPGHRDIDGNCRADMLASAGTTLDRIGPNCDIGVSLTTCKQLISHNLYNKATARWRSESTCSESRKIWPNMDGQRSKQLLKLPRIHIRNLIGVITGHWVIGRHAQRLLLPYNDFCRSCNDEEEEESTEHLLCH